MYSATTLTEESERRTVREHSYLDPSSAQETLFGSELAPIVDVLRRYPASIATGLLAPDQKDYEREADAWASASFTPADVNAWLAAGCFSPGAAIALRSVGVSAAEATARLSFPVLGISGAMVGELVANEHCTAREAAEALRSAAPRSGSTSVETLNHG